MGNLVRGSPSEFRETDPIRASRILTITPVPSAHLGACFALILLLAGRFLTERTLDNPARRLPLRVASLVLFFQSCNAAHGNILIATGKFAASAAPCCVES